MITINQLHAINVKVNVVGDQLVGKTSIIHRFVDDRFREVYLPTLGYEVTVKTLLIDGCPVIFSLWDIGGQELFDPVRYHYYQGSNGFLLVFDLANSRTFHNLDNWVVEIKKTCPCPLLIVIANKSDLSNTDTGNVEIQKKVEVLGANSFVRTSAKTGKGIEDAFKLLGTAIIRSLKVSIPTFLGTSTE